MKKILLLRFLLKFAVLIPCLLFSGQSLFAQGPIITSFSPTSGPVGTLLTITGSNLNSPTAFTIGSTNAIVISNTGSSLVGMVMPGAVTGTVSVTAAGGTTGTGNYAVTPTPYPSGQQGNKLVFSDVAGVANKSISLSLSADGNTAILAGDEGQPGYVDKTGSSRSAWIYTRSGHVWSQQGSKLSDAGHSVSLSADGNTAIAGGAGESWVYTRSGSAWSQQGSKLVGTDGLTAGGDANQGISISLSADGNTAIVGSDSYNEHQGAVWVFIRSGGVWSQQGSKLVGGGSSVSLSADGNTAIVGDRFHDNFRIYTRSGGTWSEQLTKAVGIIIMSVAINADGNTAIVGGSNTVLVFTRSAGVWSQQAQLVGGGSLKNAQQGSSVSISADGNTAIVGGYLDSSLQATAWVFTRSGSIWTQRVSQLVGTGNEGIEMEGASVSLSADGSTALLAGLNDHSGRGAVWVFAMATPAIISTAAASAISSISATLEGNISYYGAATVTERGVVYSTSANPTTSNTKVQIGAGIGAFSQSITGLSPATTYHVRAYAINSAGTSYGNDLTFTTLSANNTNLSALALSTGTLSSAFASGTTSYTASVGYTRTSLTVTPTLTDAAATVKVNGAAVASGNASGNITLNVGSNTITTIVTAHDGTTTKTYTLTVTRAALTAPAITSFTPSAGSVGTLVTVTGTSLDGITALTIGGTNAIIISGAETTLVGMVMPGAITGTVSVTTAGGTAAGTVNFTVTPTLYPSTQQGNKLVGTWSTSIGDQGAVSISADGNTAIVGGFGAAFIYVRSGSIWSQKTELVADITRQGFSVSISAEGNTALVGGRNAAWVFTRSGSTWSQQGTELIRTGNIGGAIQDIAVSISADGNTAILGGYADNSSQGAAWVFTRSGGIWTQQGNKLVGTGNIGPANQGRSVSLSADGNTALVGGPGDNGDVGAAWLFTRSGSAWSQQGTKLAGTGAVSATLLQGHSVSLSADGHTALVGGIYDNSNTGLAWVYTRSGSTWTQQGNKLVGTGKVGASFQGYSVSLSADGNTAILGGPSDNSEQGAIWLFTRSGGAWSQQGNKLVGTGNIGAASQGWSVALSADGNTAIVGGIRDNSRKGAAWVFTAAPTNANLYALVLSTGTLSPVFASGTTSYTASVSNATGTITVTPTASYATATIKVNGTAVASGSASGSITLNVGNNTITTIVTAQDGTTTKTYTVIVNRTGPPTDISLAQTALYENQPSGTQAGTLSSSSGDPSATFTYSLVGGTGDTDNSLFSISGNKLLTASSLNYEQKAGYSIVVRSTTQYGFSLDKQFTITLNDVNEAPTLAAIANQVICYTTANQNIILSGISAGPETNQATTLSLSSTNTTLFDALTVTQALGGNSTLSYHLKSDAAGTTTITVKVKDNGGRANDGVDSLMRTFTLTVNALPVVTISSDKGTNISKGETAVLTATGGTSYSWATANGIISGQNTSVLTVRPAANTTYTVTVTNASGCNSVQSIALNVLEDYVAVHGTNIVSPNGDGKNDKWVIRNIDMYPDNTVKVFDRAGRLVFFKQGYTNDWDGTIRGAQLSPDTYYYIVDFGPGTKPIKGFISIVRRR